MLHLNEYLQIHLFENEEIISEGGVGGHMSHPFDYTDFTGNDLVELINNLFAGKVEHMKEKLDGFNIGASMNNAGTVIFTRNDTDKNEDPDKGGMTVEDMMNKWADKEMQKKVYKTAGDIITEIFTKVGKKYFNPDATHRRYINCECIIAGNTNVIPYATDRVAFHGYKTYELTEIPSGKRAGQQGWVEREDIEGNVDELYKAAEGIDSAKPRPDLVIRSAQDAAKFAEKFVTKLTKLFKDEGLELTANIDDWKKKRYAKFAPDWMKEDMDIYNRLFNDDKSVKATELKKRYPDHADDIKELDKSIKKQVCGDVMEPMDNIFLSIGNELIDMLDGFTNDGAKDKVIATLKQNLEDTVAAVEKDGSDAAKEKLTKSMNRLQALGNKYNAAEGIVFMYKNRRMKLTGSFAPINQAMGTRFELEK